MISLKQINELANIQSHTLSHEQRVIVAVSNYKRCGASLSPEALTLYRNVMEMLVCDIDSGRIAK